MNMKYLTYIIVLSFFLFACEEQPVIIPGGGGGPVDTTGGIEKVVLIEELTGVSCPNCPAGTAALESILTVFGDRVVSNAIHGSFLAQPNSLSKYDFRNADAAALENFLSPFLGKPAAVIDRIHFDGQDFMTVDNIGLWQSLVQQRLNEDAAVGIELTSTYDAVSRSANIDITITAVEDVTGIIKLSAVINESYLVDSQSNTNTIIEEYEHNHVMRDMLSSVSGDVIANDGMLEGESIERSYSYTVPEEDSGEWIADNMEIIVFVSASDRDGEVLQAGKAHLN